MGPILWVLSDGPVFLVNRRWREEGEAPGLWAALVAEQAVLVLARMMEDRQEAVIALGTEFWETAAR